MSTEDMNIKLIEACKVGDLQELKRLLAAGVDLNVKIDGKRPLIFACEQGQIEVVRFLLDKGADVNEADSIGYSAIYYASRSGHYAVVDLLAFRGAIVRANNGWTPLMGAAFNSRVQLIETLVVFGDEINAANNFANSALMFASLNGHIDIVRSLLSLNADATKTDHNGRTALRLAKNDNVKQLLLDHEKKSPDEREQLANDAMIQIQHKVSIRLMRFAQGDIVGICLAFAPLELPPYVLLWIIDWLPNYNLVSHHKKIELLTSVRDSIWKIRG